MKFIDTTEIYVRSGDGGDGLSSFHRARNKPKLGPDGGNGGNGGNVVLVAEAGLNTLSSMRYKQWYKAEPGGRGGPNTRTGKCGEDKEIRVPLGTVVVDVNTGMQLGELLNEGDRLLVAEGGKRGYGNVHFVRATHQAPSEFTKGKEGEECTLKLELKLLADVGLAGFPNAGKSTLLSRMSAAKPKIADYPFTTLVPNLGVVDLSSMGNYEDSFVIADVPGLIEGASEGKGLGHEFLKHLERTRIIVYVIDAFNVEEMPIVEAYKKLKEELTRYNAELASREALVFINKMDLAPEGFDLKELLAPLKELGLKVIVGSAVQGENIKTLKGELSNMLHSEEKKSLEEVKKAELQEMFKSFEVPNPPSE